MNRIGFGTLGCPGDVIDSICSVKRRQRRVILHEIREAWLACKPVPTCPPLVVEGPASCSTDFRALEISEVSQLFHKMNIIRACLDLRGSAVIKTSLNNEILRYHISIALLLYGLRLSRQYLVWYKAFRYQGVSLPPR